MRHHHLTIKLLVYFEDGGNIVIGVDELENGQFDPKGVTPEHKESYKPDIMKDQMAKFADPYVDFEVCFGEYEKKIYVVIKVHPFKDIPVICKQEIHDSKKNQLLQRGTLYHRNNDKRVQSAPISNAHDLRSIIERAAFLKMAKFNHVIDSTSQKIMPKIKVSEILDQELKDLSAQKTLENLKSRGYWKINFRPLSLDENITNLSDCLDLVVNNKVSLRGWSYPYVPNETVDRNKLGIGNNYYEGSINYRIHRELWRMYQSTQFIHFCALWEDWEKEDSFFHRENPKEPGNALSVLGTTYHFVEVYEFLRRLVRSGIYQQGVQVKIDLCNTDGRKLVIDDPFRGPFFQEYKTDAEVIPFEQQYESEKVLLNSQDLASDCIVHFFKRFGWHQPNIQAIKEDQKKLLSGRV